MTLDRSPLTLECMSRPLRVLIAASEVDPIATSGRLGRAVGGLARALKNLRIDVRIVMPKYRTLHTGFSGLTRLVPRMRIRSVNRFGETAIYRDELPVDLPVYLIEKDKYFDRDRLYTDPSGEPYKDNAERFCFFNLCTLEMFTQIGFYPDVIHCHDWHTGLIPVYLRMLFHNDPLYAPITTLFTIHDILQQGCFVHDELGVTGLPESVFSPEGIEFKKKISFLKAGIVYANVLTTESKRYSQEIQSPEYGHGFEELLQSKSKDLYGVVNGVEYKHYDPRVDPFLVVNYTKDEPEKKQQCKQDLLSICEFESRSQVPLVGMIAPFDKQKGLELVLQSLQQILELDLQFVFLNDNGTAEPDDAKRLDEFQRIYRACFRWYAKHDQELAHKIFAGADMLLIPSKSEPCGEIQIYSLKYGTIPLVRATGGLDDTITEFHPESGKGNGFKFIDYSSESLLAMLREALAVYHNHSLWELVKTNAMRVDYSWVYSAKKYRDLYKVAMSKANLSPTLQK